jgi:hypothetical protein
MTKNPCGRDEERVDRSDSRTSGKEKAVVNRMNPTSWDATSTRVFPRCDRSALPRQSPAPKLFEINPCRDAGITADRARAR